jgi:hypothetical protein
VPNGKGLGFERNGEVQENKGVEFTVCRGFGENRRLAIRRYVKRGELTTTL